MGKNVLIPLPLLERIIALLECWDVTKCSYELRYDYSGVLWALKVKIQRLELREAYTRIVHAQSEDDRHLARIEYFRLKNLLGHVDVEPVF